VRWSVWPGRLSGPGNCCGAGRGLRRLLAPLVVALLWTAPADAHATLLTGVSDQRTAFFDSPAYRALDIQTVRLVVPWDAGLRSGPWDAWITRALRDGFNVMLALEHDGSSRCPDMPCPLPNAGAYGNALAALLARYPSIREVTAWNEPNHRSQPTFHNAAAAARYYNVARAECPTCVVVAGDFLDDSALSTYLTSYLADLTTTPTVWGLHNYFDATYFSSRGVETMLRQTNGRLWLTETGGIVSFQAEGGGGLTYDEQRSADSVSWLYDLADRRPEIDRIYLYQWQGTPDNGFDSGLLGYDGGPRPAYDVVRKRVGPRPGTPPTAIGLGTTARSGDETTRTSGEQAPDTTGDARTPRSVVLAAPGSNAVLRPERRLRLLAGGRLEIRARCVARRPDARRCRQRLVVRVAGIAVARLNVDVRARRTFSKVIRVAPWAARHLVLARVPQIQLQSCAPNGRSCTGRSSARVSKPLAR